MRKLRIMIFDDEKFILTLFKDFLTLQDYEVLTFSEPIVCPMFNHHTDSCSALSPCADVVITDFRMPGMNGLQLLEKQVRMGCALPIQNKALMSGHCAEALQGEIAGKGYVFFQKPVRLEHIKQWLRECEERSDLSAPLPPLRKEARRPISGTLTSMVGENRALLEGAAINVSESGLCLEMKSPLAPEQQVFVDADTIQLCRLATVRWVRQQEDGSYVAGLNYC
jgi:DNA-binding NtrC family response regulator